MQSPNQSSDRRNGSPGTKSAPDSPGRRLDAARLWAGGVMTAGLVGLTAMAAVLLVRGVMGIAVFSAPSGGGSTGWLAGGAAVVALTATGLLHLLLRSASRPGRLFSRIVAVSTAALVVWPFTTSASTETKVGTCVVFLAIGAALGSLLSAVGRGASARRGGG